jgi:fido (protein-threonine AMPylation protein)
MAQPSEKLAESLETLNRLQENGVVAIRSGDLTRSDRERLVQSGFLREVMKGWYIPSRPEEPVGESTSWYASFWHFCAAYLKDRFGSDWSLSPEQSLLLLVGNTTVPRQLLVRSPKGRNQITKLPHDTSLLEVRSALPKKNDLAEQENLRLFSVPSALVLSPPSFYAQYPTDARAALSMIRDASEVLNRLLEGGQSVVAGRLAGAFRNIGRTRIADDILEGMRAAGYLVRESDPFATQSPLTFSTRELSPYVNRIRLMWQAMREPVIEIFPPALGLPPDTEAYLKRVSATYALDAYHSLSIEGYRVSTELIERVRRGKWNPDLYEGDRNQRNALAARGYYQSHQAVQESVRRILKGETPGAVADVDHRIWYRELFGPSVTAGLLRPSDLAGYRNGQVFIRSSKHVPPSPHAVRDLMPAFFELLIGEESPAVRAVLGHFIFVYIHPYMDGNGRMGRFLMNTMLASGGYPWTIVPVTRRSDYMEALEEASVRQNIKPFAKFLSSLLKESIKGKIPTVPNPADPAAKKPKESRRW